MSKMKDCENFTKLYNFNKISALFCSVECMNAHMELHKPIYEAVHELESMKLDQRLVHAVKIFLELHHHLGYLEIQSHIELHQDEPRHSIFDLDWSSSDKSIQLKNHLLVIDSVKFDRDATIDEIKQLLPVETGAKRRSTTQKKFDLTSWFTNNLKNNQNTLRKTLAKFENHPTQKQFFENLFMKIFVAVGSSISLDILPDMNSNMSIGSFYHPSLLFLNHSCDPNIFIFPAGMKMSWIANRPIKAGEQLVICYRGMNPYYLNLEPKKCKFADTCEPCKNDWWQSIDIRKLQRINHIEITKIFGEIDGASFDDKYFDLLVSLEQSYKFINASFDGYHENRQQRSMITGKLLQISMILEIMLTNPTPLMSFWQYLKSDNRSRESDSQSMIIE